MKKVSRVKAKSLGLTRFDGAACFRGHKGTRLVSNGGCVDCALELNRLKYKSRITKNRAYRLGLRYAMIAAYGGRCSCKGCPEANPEFMCLDHIAGGGRKHREEIGGSTYLYRWLRNQGYPKGQFRLLCWNCNSSLGLNGYCPHTVPKSKLHKLRYPS